MIRRGVLTIAAGLLGLALATTSVAPVHPAQADDGRPAGPKSIKYKYAGKWVYSSDPSAEPQDVTTDAADRVYVVGPGGTSYMVRVYNARGKLKRSWPAAINAASQIGGITVDAAGNVHISDYSGFVPSQIPASVSVYSPTGTFLRSDEMVCCSASAGGVGVGRNGWSYVASPTTDQIVVFDHARNRRGTFSGPGSGPGRLDSPWGLAIAPNGNVVVADRNNYRIQVFTANGDYVRKWGKLGGRPGQFVGAPQSVEVRGDGVVFVTDASARVQAFTMKGKYLGKIIAKARKPRSTMTPTGLAFGKRRVLYLSGSPAPFQKGIRKYVPVRR